MELMNGSLMPENTQLGQALQPLHTTHQQLQPAYQSLSSNHQSQQQPYMEQFTQHQLANFGLLSESEDALLCDNTVTEEMSGFGGEDIFKYGSGSRDQGASNLSTHQQQSRFGSGAGMSARDSDKEKKRRKGKNKHFGSRSSVCANGQCRNRANAKCTACKRLWYCGKSCQVAHWPTHKRQCKLWKAELSEALAGMRIDGASDDNTSNISKISQKGNSESVAVEIAVGGAGAVTGVGIGGTGTGIVGAGEDQDKCPICFDPATSSAESAWRA
jgi:hypothetical protein